MTKESQIERMREVAYANGQNCKEYGTTHYPHGWLDLNASFSGVCPTIDSSIWKHHTLLLEVENDGS